ncbi:TPA: hypothetical protein N0F65_008110 [Lagenidium giganteum]|uniref:YdbS-like PH domain-containing protein n=1 Tax=Lagenidium giganteum TaxID=4803 RepID=A0AAV2YZK6_9STRA|nr:TPA: hypothetical protein N0F65_008110 [Lagenidium giganteum]
MDTTKPSEQPLLTHVTQAATEVGTFEVEFDRDRGYNYVCWMHLLALPCCFPIVPCWQRKEINAQKCRITDKRLVLETGWLNRSSKNIPLDRIQDINVEETCFQRCCGVKGIEIQTAGTGGPGVEAEAYLIAPKDAEIVRDVILERRDALVLGSHGGLTGGGLDGTWRRPGEYPGRPQHTDAIVSELQALNGTVQRIEKRLQQELDARHGLQSTESTQVV